MKSIYLCRSGSREWGLFELKGDSFTSLAEGSLITLVATAADRLQRSISFTMTGRFVEEIAAHPDAIDAGDLVASLADKCQRRVIPAITTIMMPTGEAHAPDLWTSVFVSSGRLMDGGSACRFRQQRLSHRLLAMLEQSDVFIAGVQLGRRLRGVESGAAAEEIHVRPSWRAIEILPDAFPKSKPTAVPMSPQTRDLKAAKWRTRRAEWYQERRLEKSGHVFNEKTRSWQRHPKSRPVGSAMWRGPGK